MKFFELIKDNPVFDVEYFKEWYPDHNVEKHQEVFEYLKTLEPVEPENSKSFEIFVQYSDPDNEAPFYHTSGYSKIEDITYAIEFVPWAEWLGMEIKKETLESLTPSQIIVHCIWEMTWGCPGIVVMFKG